MIKLYIIYKLFKNYLIYIKIKIVILKCNNILHYYCKTNHTDPKLFGSVHQLFFGFEY